MTVSHRLGSYEIAFLSLEEVHRAISSGSYVVTDENVARHYGRLISDTEHLVLKPGEEQKCLESYREILYWLADKAAPRSSTIVALGGGVIGDLVGFAAASYMRGVRLIQIPTTLLSQVDSSIGGKVGIDLPQGKNLAGAFYPPSEVLICAETLQTLEPRQITNGMAEVWKYAFIMDQAFCDHLTLAKGKPEDTQYVVRKCLEHKKHVVEADELETTGLRAILNFGHTIGHAIEQVTGYREFLHGEAISIGMTVEARLGEIVGITQPGTLEQVERCLQLSGLPTTSDVLHRSDELIAAMKRDKKALEGKLAFSLVTQIGECKLVKDLSLADVEAAMRAA